MDDMAEHSFQPYVIRAGRAWTGSLFVMLGLAILAAATLTVVKPGPASITLFILVAMLTLGTAWRGWGRICDRMAIDESGLLLRSIWPARSINVEANGITKVWLSPNSGTVRLFTRDRSYVLRVRGDLINAELADRLAIVLNEGVLACIHRRCEKLRV